MIPNPYRLQQLIHCLIKDPYMYYTVDIFHIQLIVNFVYVCIILHKEYKHVIHLKRNKVRETFAYLMGYIITPLGSPFADKDDLKQHIIYCRDNWLTSIQVYVA